MPNQIVTPFRRAFANRNLVKGAARAGLFWSILAGLAAMLLIALAGLILSLLIHRGQVSLTLSGEDLARFQALTGEVVFPSATDEPPAEPAPASGPPPAAAGPAAPGADGGRPVEVIRDNTGILPAVWASRDRWWGPLLARAYRGVPALRSNVPAACLLVFIFAVLALVRLGCLAEVKRQSRAAAIDMGSNLRRAIHRQSLRLGTEDVSGTQTDEFVRLFTDETETLQNSVYEWIYRTLRHPWELLALYIAMLSIDPLLTLQWLPPVGLCWYLLASGRRRAAVASNLATDRSRHELDLLAASLRRSRLVRGFGLETADQELFNNHLTRYVHNTRLKARAQDDVLWLRLVFNVMIAVVLAFLVFLTAVKVVNPPYDLTPAEAILFLGVLAVSLVSVSRLVQLREVRRRGNESAQQIFRHLDLIPQVSQAVGAKFLQPLSRSLQFDGVTYTAPDQKRPTLRQLDLKLAANRSYAVVSVDPPEAKTLVSLLPRYIEPQKGRILIDGEDLAWGTLESIRAEIMVVSADNCLIPGTVLDNIRAGGDFSLQQCTEAAKATHAHQFIVSLFNGYETEIDPRDSQLTLGQRYRLALTRALLRRPALLVIEEPTDPLDEDTKAYLEDTYSRIFTGRTVIILPARISTLRMVDQIVVLAQGRVEAIGPHSELVKDSPIYRHWEYLHFNEFRHMTQG